MEPGPPHGVCATDPTTGSADLPRCQPLSTSLGVTESVPDEPLAVVATGPGGAARREVLADLLDLAPGMLVVPDGSYLVVSHARMPTRAAYVPGYRQPHEYGAEQIAAGLVLARPPRRVELTVPNPLLRHFALLDTPDTGTLGRAGARVLLDTVGPAGALLFVISADQAFTATELDLLAEVSGAAVQVFFVLTPGAAPPGPDPVAVTVAAHRAALLSAVPGLAEAQWYPLRPGDTAGLRRALVGWAADEGLRRSGAHPQAPAGAHGRVTLPPGSDPGDWSDRLDRQVRSSAQRIRQHLALELANIHLRVVQDIVFGGGCAGLPYLLDREVHALSLLATAQCDLAVRRIVDDGFGQVFGTAPEEGVRRRIAAAVCWGLDDHQAGQDLDRVLLVTGTAGVAGLTGAGASDALAGYRCADRVEILPPVAVALSGGCYRHWRSPGNDDPGAARAWAQRALRELELELSREVSRRFEAVRLSLSSVLSDAVDHGILLA